VSNLNQAQRGQKGRIKMDKKKWFVKKLANGIKLEHDLHAGVVIVWSPDGDYDAVYNIEDKAGIEKEIKFVSEFLTLGAW
jgi:hypothetical protein